MGLRISNNLRNARANQVTNQLDAGSGSATVAIYTGPQPANPDAAETGTLLATFTLEKPSFSASVAGAINVDATPALVTNGIADGDAGWFRGYDSDANPVIDGTVSAGGGGGNLEINTITVSIGLELRITGGGFVEPVGT